MRCFWRKIQVYSFLCAAWIGIPEVNAQEKSANVSLSIYASACSNLGVSVNSFTGQVMVDGARVEMPFFLVLVEESDLRLMLRNPNIDIDMLKFEHAIIPVKYINEEFKIGGSEISDEGKKMVVQFCETFR